MDLRTERTKRSIINAFLELRSKKPLEKITVKELSELAFINKATFYTHYQDIYDLSEQLETEFVTNILNQIPYTEFMIDDTKACVEKLFLALSSQKSILDILFSGNRFSVLAQRLERGMMEQFYEKYLERKDALDTNVIFSMLIQGCFHAYTSYATDQNLHEIIEIIGNISDALVSSQRKNRSKE